MELTDGLLILQKSKRDFLVGVVGGQIREVQRRVGNTAASNPLAAAAHAARRLSATPTYPL